MRRLPIRALDPTGGVDGNVPTISGGRFVLATPAGGSGGGSAPVAYGATWPADDPPATPNPMDDEFAGSSLDPKWTLTHGTTASPTVTVEDGLLVFDAVAEAGWKVQGLTQPLPASGDWTFTLAVAGFDAKQADFAMPAYIGLAAGSSGTAGGVQIFGYTRYGVRKDYSFEIGYGTTWATYSASQHIAIDGEERDGYLRVRKTGTTYSWEYSRIGRKFYPLLSATLPFTPGRVLIGAKSENAATSPVALFKWFRRTA